MEKLLSFIMMMSTMIIFTIPAFASTKYDAIVAHHQWKEIMQLYDTNLASNRTLNDYLNLLVNKNDLNRIVKNGELDKEKSKFIAENSREFLKYLHAVITAKQLQYLKPEPTDAHYIYVIGVIKDPKAQAAKNGHEYEMEKALFRGMPLYALWEKWRTEGFIKEVISEQIDLMFAGLQKQQKRSKNR